MPPGGAGKRKRGDRSYSGDGTNDGFRPSPHRPNNLSLAQHSQSHSPSHSYHRDGSARGGRRGSRGSRPLNSPNTPTHQQRQFMNAQNSASPTSIVTPSRSEPVADRPQSQPKAQPTISDSTQTSPDSPATLLLYEIVTDDVLHNWKDKGQTTIVEAGRIAQEARDVLALGAVYQEILRSGLYGRLSPFEAGDTVRRIISTTPTNDYEKDQEQDRAESFLDIVAISAMNESKNPNLRPILLASQISLQLIRLVLDSEMLQDLQFVRSNFKQVEIRYQTNLLYRQANFNLLREESEGYSKLITDLFTTIETEQPTTEVAAGTFEKVKAMIGAFNLDVGRVLDITMDVFAAVLVKHNRFLVKFLRASPWWPEQPLAEARHSHELGLDPLPKWVWTTGHAHLPMTADEKAELVNVRHERDTRFWKRAEEVGSKAFFELGGRRADAESLEISVSDIKEDSGGFEESDKAKDGKTGATSVSKPSMLRHWTAKTGTLPPQGNEYAAQILGFKLRYYGSPARGTDDHLPSNLIYLAALLIKIGFISLIDLYPHLLPSDDGMEAMRLQKLKEKEEREKKSKSGGPENALSRAAALVDDTMLAPTNVSRRPVETNSSALSTKLEGTDEKQAATGSAPDVSDHLPEPIDQKVQLLKSLLAIGALPEALYILGRFPWLVDVVPDLYEHIHRILHYSLSRIYDTVRPLHSQDGVRESDSFADLDQQNLQKGGLPRTKEPQKKVLRWAQIDRMETGEGHDYRFYWEDWSDNIPQCQTINDVFLLCNTILNISGLKIGQDPTLVAKLARIGLHSLDSDLSDFNKSRWAELCKRLLVPSLSFAQHNSGSIAEVWTLLKRFPTITRFNIYFEWYTGQTARLPALKEAFGATSSETKDVLKRISKTNTRLMARALAKVAVASPGKVFEVAIKQIESYDNLIEVIVEASRYFTDLGYDVLTWSLINSLGQARSRVQSDGMLTSRWLSALAQFCGTVFKRYAVMNPTPVLQYVTYQVLRRNSTDLVVLEHLIHSMAGIVFDATFNDNQVLAMTGGPCLRAHTMGQLLDRRQESGMRTSSKRLMKALINAKIAGTLLVAIAQERQACLFNIDEEHSYLKLIGNLFDEIHRVFTQYLDLLHTNLSRKDFDALVPSPSQLIENYRLEPSIAFWVWRPLIATEISEYDKAASEKSAVNDKLAAEARSKELSVLEDGSKDVVMVDADNNLDNQRNEGRDCNLGKSPEDLSTTQATNTPKSSEAKQTSDGEPGFVWHPVVKRSMENVKPTLPATTFEILSETFYFTFWRLSPYDLNIPDTYQEESRRLTVKIEQLKADRSDGSAAARSREQQRKQLTETNTKLTSEFKEHLAAWQRTKVTLGKEKDFWFENCWGKWDDLNIALLEHCFIPRILLSAVDAYYVFKMLKILHSMGAKNFRTMAVLDCLFNAKRLAPLIWQCTAKEAEHFGRFLNEVLKDLGKWHGSKELYEKEAFGTKKDLSGFRRNLSQPDSFLDWESFRTLFAKWHKNLHEALRDCFKGGEYMHIRNAIIVLKAVVLNFPVIDWMGRALVASVTDLSETDKREDLKLAAMSLLGNLKRREKQWVTAPVFARNKPPGNGATISKPTLLRAKTPQPESTTIGKSLNAKAQEFVPNALSLGPTKTLDSTKVEAEDGEIKTPTTANLKEAPANPFSSNRNTTLDADFVKSSNERQNDENLRVVAPLQKEREVTPQIASSSAPQSYRSNLPAKPDLKSDTKSTDIPAAPSRLRLDATRTQVEPSKPRHPTHTLPSRPEVPQIVSRAASLRSGERLSERSTGDGRDPRDNEYRRSERAVDEYRDQHSDRHSVQRPYDHSDRSYPVERDKQDLAWGGEKPPSHRAHDDRHIPYSRTPIREERTDRSLRDRSHLDSSKHHHIEAYDSRSRESSKALGRATFPSHGDRIVSSKPPIETDKIHTIVQPDRRTELVKADNASISGSQRGSRASSPSRRDDRTSRSDYRDERSMTDSRRHVEEAPSSRSRHEDTRLPTGPRTERHSDLGSSALNDRSRDNFRAPLPSAHHESTNNRLSQDHNRSRQYESSYGRLNQDPPAGPRMVNGNHPPVRAPHNANASQLVGDQRPSISASSTLIERQAPTGPASSRGPPRSSAPLNRPAPISTSIPPASASESPDTAGVHPDRLKAIQNTGGAGGLESSTHARTSQVAVESPLMPRGPSSTQAPEAPNSARSAGPPLVNTQADRSRSDKRFAGINTVLSQTDRFNQPTNVRGRGGRSNIVSSPITGGPQRRDFSAPTELIPPARQDSFSNRPPNGASGPREEDPSFARRSMRSDDRRPPRARDARSASPRRHPTHFGSREDLRASRLEDTHPRDHRGRGAPPLPQPPLMSDGRDRRAPREGLPSGKGDLRRDGERRDNWGGERMGPERRDRPERRESGMSHSGSMRDSGMEGGGSGRKRPRAAEELYEQPKTAYDHSKRPRRG